MTVSGRTPLIAVAAALGVAVSVPSLAHAQLMPLMSSVPTASPPAFVAPQKPVMAPSTYGVAPRSLRWPVASAPAPTAAAPAAVQPLVVPYSSLSGSYAAQGAPPAGTAGLGPQGAPADRAEGTGREGLLIGGGLTLGLFYASSALTGAALGKICSTDLTAGIDEVPDDVSVTLCEPHQVQPVYIPFVGPFITAARLSDSPASMWPLDVALVSLGLGQITGAALLVAGVAKGSGADRGASGQAAVTIDPMVGPGALGLTLRGSL
jgi:hypothetical protein